MLVVVYHTVLDPVFWEAAAKAPLMPYLKLHQVLPSADGHRGVCLWEAESLAEVRDHIETFLGDVSRNEYFEVNQHNAMILSLAGSLTEPQLDEWAPDEGQPVTQEPS
jgi:hypothetical protein